jgi:hypothetical protein
MFLYVIIFSTVLLKEVLTIKNKLAYIYIKYYTFSGNMLSMECNSEEWNDRNIRTEVAEMRI